MAFTKEQWISGTNRAIDRTEQKMRVKGKEMGLDDAEIEKQINNVKTFLGL